MKRIKITMNSPVTLTFILLCFLVTVLGTFTHSSITQSFFMTYRSSLLSPLTYVRLFTHVFGHSGFEHFLNNATYLLLLGPMLEEKYGSKNLLYVIGITAVTTAIIHSVFFPGIGLCGASGVVFAFIVLSSFTSVKNGEIPFTFILVSLFFIGTQIYQGLAYNDNISNLSHIIGGVCGGLFGYNFHNR